jgi:dTDP-L-rhamnose 4-epimerase
MSNTILVTGGAGFIGSHLVDALVAQGNDVRVFDNLEPQVHGPLREQGRWPDYCSPEAEYVLGDVRDRDALQRAMTGIDVVFHEAAMVGVGQSMYQIERYIDVNTRGTAVLLDILANEPAIRSRVRKLMVASSMSIYGEGKYCCAKHGIVHPKLRPDAQLAARDWEPHCPDCGAALAPLPTDEEKPLHATSIYAISKKDQEEMCLAVGRTYSIPTVALRYFNTYGSRQALSNPYTGVAAIFCGRLLNDRPPVIFEDGQQRRDFVHVSDIVQANLLAMQQEAADHRVFNVGTGRALSIVDVAEGLSNHLGYASKLEITQKVRAGDIRHCYADISRIQALGYRPRVQFADGLAELVRWVRSQTAEDRFEDARRELISRGLVPRHADLE